MAVLRSPHSGLPPGPSREELGDEPSLEDIIFSLGLELGGAAVDGEGSGGDTSSTTDSFRPQRLGNSFGNVLSPPSVSPVDADVFLSKPLPSQDDVETSLGARVGGSSEEVTKRKGTQSQQQQQSSLSSSHSEELSSPSSHQPSRLLSRFYDDLRKKNPELFERHNRSSAGESPVSPRSEITSPRSEFTLGNHGSEDSRGRRRAGSLARSDSGHSVAESHSSRGSDESRMSLKERLEKNKQNMQQLLSRQPFPPKGLSKSRENMMTMSRGRSESDPFSERREVTSPSEFRTAGNSAVPRQTPSPNQRTGPSQGLRQSASSSDLPARGYHLPHTQVPAADLQKLRLARTRSPDSHHDSAVDMDSVSLQSGQGPTEQSSEGLSNGSEPYHYHRGYHTADSDADSGISRPHRPAVQRSTAASSPDESDPSTRHRGNHRVRERPLSANHREALRLLQQARSKATPLKADHSIRPVVARPKDSPHGIDSYLQQGARPKNGILQNGNSSHLVKSGHGSDRENYPPGNNHSPTRTSRKSLRNGETARVRFMDDVGVCSEGDVPNGVVDGPLGALTREGDAHVTDRENRRNRKRNGSHGNHSPSPWSERNGALIHEEIIQTDNFILPDTYIGSSPEGSERLNTPSPINHNSLSLRNRVHDTPSPRNHSHQNVQVQVHSSSQSDSTISNGSLSSHGRAPRPSSRTDRHSPSARPSPANQRSGNNGTERYGEPELRSHKKSPDANGTYRSSSASPSNISIEDPYEQVDLDNGRNSRNSRQPTGLQSLRDGRAQDDRFLRTSYVGISPDSLKTPEPEYATVDKTRKQRKGKERPESAKSAGSSSSSNPCVVEEVDVGIESIEKPKEKKRGNTRDLAGFPDEDLRSSRSSLFDRMQSFGKASKKKFHSLRRAVSLQALDRPNQPAEPEAKLKKTPSLMSLKKTPSLRSLTNLSFRRKKDIDRSRQYMVEDDLHRDTQTRSSDRRRLRPSSAKSDNVSSGSKAPSPPKRPSSARGEQDLDTSSVSSPGHFRTIGRLVKMMPDNTQVIELIKPPHGPFGFYIARGNEKYNHGIFVSRLSDGYPDKLFAGLLGLGDEILEINGVAVNTITLDDVYDLMAETKEKLVLRVLPLLARNDW